MSRPGGCSVEADMLVIFSSVVYSVEVMSATIVHARIVPVRPFVTIGRIHQHIMHRIAFRVLSSLHMI